MERVCGENCGVRACHGYVGVGGVHGVGGVGGCSGLAGGDSARAPSSSLAGSCQMRKASPARASAACSVHAQPRWVLSGAAQQRAGCMRPPGWGLSGGYGAAVGSRPRAAIARRHACVAAATSESSSYL